MGRTHSTENKAMMFEMTGTASVTGSVSLSGDITGSVSIENLLQLTGTSLVRVTGSTLVTGSVSLAGPAEITVSVLVTGSVSLSAPVEVTGSVLVTGSVTLSTPVEVTGYVLVTGSVFISSPVELTGFALVTGAVTLSAPVEVSGTVLVSGTATVTGSASVWLRSETGASYGVKHINNKPRVSAMPYTYDIAEGNVADHRAWSKIGINLAIPGTAYEVDMAPYLTGAYRWPTAEKNMYIKSSSIQDRTGATGARHVTVYYLDDGFAEHTKTVTLNGTNKVQIASDMYRVQNARVVTAGVANKPVGNLTIATGTVTYGYITAGRTRMRQCTWTVPTGATLYVTQIAFSSSDQSAGKYCRLTTKANYDNLSGEVLQRGLFMPFNEVTLNNTAYTRELNPPTKLPATTDLKVSAVANSAAAATCSLRGWLETGA